MGGREKSERRLSYPQERGLKMNKFLKLLLAVFLSIITVYSFFLLIENESFIEVISGTFYLLSELMKSLVGANGMILFLLAQIIIIPSFLILVFKFKNNADSQD